MPWAACVQPLGKYFVGSLTPVVVQSSVWIENLSNAQTILDEGQAKSVTTDAFGNHQPNYRISCLGSIPWFYFNQCHEN